MGHIGSYRWDENGLPRYAYTGKFPAKAKDCAGRDSKQPEDPCFILGNNRLTAFAHVSGQIELITGERGWARLNHVEGNHYWNRASVKLGGKTYQLAGEAPYTGPLRQKEFGVGYVRYQEELPKGLRVSRIISVMPSRQVNEGTPALLIRVCLTNTNEETVECIYSEALLAHYCMLSAQEELTSKYPAASYEQNLEVDEARQLAKAQFRFQMQKLLLPAVDEAARYPYDCFPPVLFLKGLGPSHVFTGMEPQGDVLCCEMGMVLKPGESRAVEFLIGMSFSGEAGITDCIQQMLSLAGPADSCGAYADLWADVLPDFKDEENELLRWEMLWNAYVLRAMANYHSYFRETTLPQGSVYAYRLGQNTSMRDHLQHTLALSYLDPALAKSSLRFVLKHECFDGRILRQDVGFGYEDPSIYVESDPQLYLIMAVGEYLRITGDYDFLLESVDIYPVEEWQKTTVLYALVRAFIWLRDVVGRGRHGLVMMRNSDWSDSFFHTYSPNLYAQVAESHLNTAMALVVLPQLVKELKKFLPRAGTEAELTQQFIEEMTAYRAQLFDAFMRDMEGRIYAPRCYIGFDDEPKLRFGEDRLCLEAQPWLLQMEDFPEGRKRELYAAIQVKVLDPEKLGARTRERPLWGDEGAGEDGGMWFAHQGPLMVGLATFSKEEAYKLMGQLTFRHFAEMYPDYWVGHWTAADSVESSLSRSEGMYRPWVDNAFQPFCAHPHAWMLYCYYRLFCESEEETR